MPVIPGLISPQLLAFLSFFSGLSHVKFLRHAFTCQPMRGNQRQSWILDSDYWILDLSVDLDSRFQLSVRCRIPTAVFRNGRPRIPDSTSKKFPRFRIPRAKIPRIPLHVENTCVQPVWHVHFDTINYVIF